MPNVGPYIYTTLVFLALLGAPYIYGISYLRVNGAANSAALDYHSLTPASVCRKGRLTSDVVGTAGDSEVRKIISKYKKKFFTLISFIPLFFLRQLMQFVRSNANA